MKTQKAKVLYSGQRHKIFAIVEHGRCPTTDFIDDLEASDEKKIVRLLETTADNETPNNREKFKKIEGTEHLYEFKSHQVRLPCFFDDDRIIIVTHGLKKKRDKLDKAEVERAERLRRYYLED